MSEMHFVPYMFHPVCLYQSYHLEKLCFPFPPVGGGVGFVHVCSLSHCTESGYQVSAIYCPACKEEAQ